MPRNAQDIVRRDRRFRREILAFPAKGRVGDFAFAFRRAYRGVRPTPRVDSLMRRLLASAFAALLSLVAAPVAAAREAWTFCVASARGSDNVWITDVFAATRDRVRFVAELMVRAAARSPHRAPEPEHHGADKPALTVRPDRTQIISQRVAPRASAASFSEAGVVSITSRDSDVIVGVTIIARIKPAVRNDRPRCGASIRIPHKPNTTDGTTASRSIR